MAARTGEEYLRGLADGRRIWVDGERVSDVRSHPALAGAANAMASIYDLQRASPEACLVEDPESGETSSASHMIPRSAADLARRHKCLERIAEYSVGLLGRTPDYLNVTFAGFAGRDDEWRAYGNEAGAANIVRFQETLKRRDLALTHTIIHPTVDKSGPEIHAGEGRVALHKVEDTANGILVRGARVLATLAPFSDEIAVYPGQPLPAGSKPYALAFSIPTSTPGLKFICRDSVSRGTNRYDHPLSSRFDEQDAFVVFDDVEVPHDRIFIDGNLVVYNSVMRTSWSPNIMQQAMIRAQTKLEFAYGLGCRMAEVTNDRSPATLERLGEMCAYSELARAAVRAAEVDARDYGNGLWLPDDRPLNQLRSFLPVWFPRVNELLRLIGSHNLLATPTRSDFDDPELRPLLDRYLSGAPDADAELRVRVFRLAWDFVASALGGRNEQYERFYLASAQRNLQLSHTLAPKERSARLVDRFLKEEI
jgi:4-hydroxyphenylacetate 3-monooxygenase